MSTKPYPRLFVVIDRIGSRYIVGSLTEALQVQSLYKGSTIMQQDDAMSPAFVLRVSKAEENRS